MSETITNLELQPETENTVAAAEEYIYEEFLLEETIAAWREQTEADHAA